ncbi:protein BRANCHLESS TRICHOME [Lolium rigidum]|uniref:protein BRANCHLESS TRICHOME n=1 Tax=Lolium rigidum TaxID=89674 RepID=UPI001F5CDE77|nr:protein BRANCHLESS TRICHOME [Lolium rigidum]
MAVVVAMALVAGTAPGNLRLSLNHGAGVASSPSWKLYHNPHYSSSSPRGEISSSTPSRSTPHSRRKDRTSMIVADFEDGDGMERRLGSGHGIGGGGVASVSELVARVEELGAELEFERRMRRKVEALNDALAAELAEERRRTEAERARLREELDEERRMLRVAELWREERVRMKLADARDAFVEKLREVAADAGHRAADANAGNCGCCRSSGVGSPIGGKASPASGQRSPAGGQHGQQSPTRGQSHRREGAGGENPHIRRGIKGSVEFPRAVRVRPRGEDRVDLASNLECQRAQLRVLMRHRSPATDAMGLVDAAPDSLVV